MLTVRLAELADLDGWRRAARALDLRGTEPDAIAWRTGDEAGELFGDDAALPAAEPGRRVPAAFVELARLVVCHADPARFDLLYRLLRRLRAEPHLLALASDPQVHRASAMARAVRRDRHKMTAFVRFKEMPGEGGPVHVAWYEPDHFVVDLAAPFFARRFAGMRWSILTPYRSLHWDGVALATGPGAARRDVPDEDRLEEHWRAYYAAIFNPARLKPKAMQAEMPKKFWRNLPEARLIAPLIRAAAARQAAMIAAPATLSAAHSFRSKLRDDGEMATLFDEARTLGELGRAEQACTRCPLYRDATQAVPGEGPEDARMMLVGEQPGDQEDLKGRPFVGPAGKLLDRALDEAGIDRTTVYLTNAVKHFKFEPRGKRRIHQKPDAGEIKACRWWLDQERELVRPELIVALGATAIQGLQGPKGSITSLRSQPMRLDERTRLLVTVHPSYLLRLPDPELREREYAKFVADLTMARALVADAA